MLVQVKNIFIFLILLIPLFLITGPALPDIIVSLSVLFGISYLFYLKKYKEINNIGFFNISIYLWFSLIFISLFSYNKITSFQDSIIFLRFLLIPILMYYIFFKSEKIIYFALVLILGLVIFVCIDTFYQFLNYTSENGFGNDLFGFKSNWYGRLTGPFGDELIPGSYISKFGLLGYVLLILNKKFRTKSFLHAFYLSSILLVSFVTGERMAFATFLMSLLFLFIFLAEYRKSIFLSILFGVLAIFITLKTHPFYNDYKIIESTQFHQGLKIEKFFKCNNEYDESCSKIIELQPSFLEVIKNFKTSAYGEIYSLSLNMFLDNPITGIGINNFKYLCVTNSQYTNMMTNYSCASHPHNIYIQWLTEGGLIVFIIFIVYLYFLINFIIKDVGDKNYKIIALAVILIMFWPIMSTGSLVKNWYGVTTFFILGMCMCLSKIKNKDYT